MSRLYDNIKVLCKYKGVQIRDIEKPLRAGTISRYERRGTIMNLPIGLVHRASKLLDVSIEDLLEKDIANEIWGEKMSNEIYGIFKRSELSDELVEDLHKQVDLILEYAKKQKAKQTEPNCSEKPNNCEKDCFLCKWLGDVDVCGRCRNRNLFAEADTEPTISKMEQVDEPQTEQNLILPERIERGEMYEVGNSIVVMNSEDYYDLLCKSWEKDEAQTECNQE